MHSPQKLYKQNQRAVFRYSADTASFQGYNVNVSAEVQADVGSSELGGSQWCTPTQATHTASLCLETRAVRKM